MKQAARHYQCQLAVVGTGLAGMAATVFALKKGIDIAQAGNTGALAYTTGYLDLLGMQNGRLTGDPLLALDALRNDQPLHPLSRLSTDTIRHAFYDFTESISAMGVGYSVPGKKNHFAFTPVGTTKPTFSIPLTMLEGVNSKRLGRKTLIVDFNGLQGFSAKEIVSNLSADWSHLTATRLQFPGTENQGRLFPEVMARMLEVPERRQQFAEQLSENLNGAEAVGMPAIMGVHTPDKVHEELQSMVGVPLFEIPTMPPGVPGIRIREMCEQAFPAQGVSLIPQKKIQRLDITNSGAKLYLRDSYGDVEIDAQTVLLATGRFLSGGLMADRHRIREPLLSLPVTQPRDRNQWYDKNYFGIAGHAINRSGIQVDDHFRPLDRHGKLVNPRLFAAGSILAGQDWIRQRCGAGVAIASAWKAVDSIAGMLNK